MVRSNAGNKDIASDLSEAERDKVLPASCTASLSQLHVQLPAAGWAGSAQQLRAVPLSILW